MIVNLDSLRTHHRRWIDQHHTMVDDATEEARQYARHYVDTKPTFTPRTGNLQRSVNTRFVRTQRGNIVRVSSDGNRARYNLAIERGARPHVIRARRKRALRFVWHGQLVFFRKVNHPGNRPYFFLREATYAAGHLFEQRMTTGMQTLAKRF